MGEALFESPGEPLPVLEFAFPDNDNIPTTFTQFTPYTSIASRILRELVLPERKPRFGCVRKLTSGMTVPKTAMHEDDGSILRQNNIGLPWKVSTVQPKPKSHLMKSRSN